MFWKRGLLLHLVLFSLTVALPATAQSGQPNHTDGTPGSHSQLARDNNPSSQPKSIKPKDSGAPTTSGPVSAAKESSAGELNELRGQLERAQDQIESLRTEVDAMRQMLQQFAAAAPARPSATAGASESTVAQAPLKEKPALKQESKIDQLIKPKYEGGQFSGAEGLYKTDRLKIGGYLDFRYVSRGFDERREIQRNIQERGESQNFRRSTFSNPRYVLGVAAALTDRLLFNSEVEFENGGKETEVEQAYLEYRLAPKFNLRAGVIVMPLGRFNLFHDSNLQDVPTRPLVSTFVIPSTYSDAGAGAFGTFKLGPQWRLSYEGYVVNGLRSSEGGEFTRADGLIESKDNNVFFDNNTKKSVVGRLVLSPRLGVELGFSGYRGKHDEAGRKTLSIWAVDWKYNYRGLQVLGEYARTALQRDPESESELAVRNLLLRSPKGTLTLDEDFLKEQVEKEFFDKPARSTDGWYVEARYRFRPRWMTERFRDETSFAPVIRFDQINLDRSFPDFRFPLNQRRLSLGFAFRLIENASFNFSYNIERAPSQFLRVAQTGLPFGPFFANAGRNGPTVALVWAF